jgi:hypothetical protein
MKKQTFITALLISIMIIFSSCSVIGDIFKAGIGVGVFLVVLVVAIIIYFVMRMGKSK